MVNNFKILIVDDEAGMLESLSDVLEQGGYQVVTANSGKDALQILAGESQPNLAIVDFRMPNMSGLQLLEEIRFRKNSIAVIMLTAYGSVDSAVKAMKLGAIDYLSKPVNPEELLLIIDKERERQQLVRQNAYFMEELSKKYHIENIVGRSAAMLPVFEKMGAVSASDAPVLILGESGTGKELIAYHLHYAGPRQKGPLITVSCATFSSGLIESELFGHERGAFTGAIQTKLGRLELAHCGTLFLDEIGDIPLAYQTKLLRVLQSHQIERVGSNRSLKSDFRLISATNHKLKEDIRNEKFREDLYYRINVVEITVPPLRERKEDIPLLITHFIKIYNQKTNKSIQGTTREFLETCEAYSWPGNVRELKNILESAFVYCCEDLIGIQHLPSHIVNPGKPAIELSKFPTRSLDEIEKAIIIQCLLENNGNKTKSAEQLGITRSTLQSKLKKHSLN